VTGDDHLTVGEVLDGLSLWDEHKPQSGEDWVAVAERFIAAGDSTEQSSPLFAGLVMAVQTRDRYEEALRRVVRDRRERDKILMEVQLTLGLTADDVKEIDRGR